MCRTETGFQNGDCVLTMSSWGIRVMRRKYLLLRRPSIFQASVSLPRTCYLFDTRNLGNWHNATVKLTFLRVFWWQLCRLLTSSRHKGVRSLLISYSETWMCGLADCCFLCTLLICKKLQYGSNPNSLLALASSDNLCRPLEIGMSVSKRSGLLVVWNHVLCSAYSDWISLCNIETMPRKLAWQLF